MPGAQAPVTIYNPDIAPASWTRFVAEMLGASPGLARTLWRHFRRTATGDEVGVVVRAKTRPGGDTWRAMVEMLTPRRCFDLLGQVSPEGAGPRHPQVIQAEATVMHRALNPETWRPLPQKDGR